LHFRRFATFPQGRTRHPVKRHQSFESYLAQGFISSEVLRSPRSLSVPMTA
jgi:hypothetical protein